MTAQYATTGGEFPQSGLCDAWLKVYNGAGILLYSLQAKGAVMIQSVPAG
jgi:hypothetical protein